MSESPPLIVGSNMRPFDLNRTTPASDRARRGRTQATLAFRRQPGTRERLLEAVRPLPDTEAAGAAAASTSSSRALALASAPSQRPLVPAVSSRHNNRASARAFHPGGQRPTPQASVASASPSSLLAMANTANHAAGMVGAFPSSSFSTLPSGNAIPSSVDFPNNLSRNASHLSTHNHNSLPGSTGSMPHQETQYQAILNQLQNYMSEAAVARHSSGLPESTIRKLINRGGEYARLGAQMIGMGPNQKVEQNGSPASNSSTGPSVLLGTAPNTALPHHNTGTLGDGSRTSWPGMYSAYPGFQGYAGYGGALPADISEILDDKDLLASVLDPNFDDDLRDEEDEPIDADMQEILNNMADGTFHGSDALASLYGDKGIDVAKLPLYSATESLFRRGLKTSLHTHQLQGLLWMIKAEHRRVSTTEGKQRGLWVTRKDRNGRVFYFNVASRKTKRIAPILPRGGINSDSMGLGKTIQIIATCLADRNTVPVGTKPVEADHSKSISEGQAGSSSTTKQVQAKANEEDDDADSEEDYVSSMSEENDDEEGEEEESRTSDSSVTEDDSDFAQSPVKKIRKTFHRPTDSQGMAVKSESASGSDSDSDEKVNVGKSAKRQKKAMAVKPEDEQDSDYDDKKKKSMPKKRKRTKKVAETKGGSASLKDTAKGKEKSNANAKDASKVKYNETTLVICPLSVLQNWTSQVDQHCDRRKVHYYTYHGELAKNVRKKSDFEGFFSKHNFIFTTYDTVRTEFLVIRKRREAGMLRLKEIEERRLRRELKEQSGGASGATLTPSDNEDEDLKKPQLIMKEDREEEEEDSKAKNSLSSRKGKGRDDSTGKGKSETWYDSDDSFVATDDEEMDDLPKVKKDDPRDHPLFEVNWRRIVLDEAHTCRNPRTTLYNSICELKSERRWAVTGTPIVNSTKDLGALAAWCGLQPFSQNLKDWSLLIERPLKKENTSERAAALLRKVVTSICLRRHKSMKNAQGEPIVKLPEIKFYKHSIPLTPSDRDYYTKCEMACREHLERWMRQGDVNEHRSAILVFLLRLRQMSCHRRLIGNTLLEEIQNKDWDSVDRSKELSSIKLTKEDILQLQEKLKTHVEMNDDCPICMEALLGKEPMITPCGHPFCKSCLGALVNPSNFSNVATCPMDRKPLPGIDKMIELPIESTVEEDGEDGNDEEFYESTSAKVGEALKIVRGTLKRDPTEKILIFSNFVKFLNIVGEELKESKISHARFNGELNVHRRVAVLESFCTPVSARQSGLISRNINRLEEQIQKERAIQRAKAKAAAAESEEKEASASATVRKDKSQDGSDPSSDAVSVKSSSSLMESLRRIDQVGEKSKVDAKGKGKQKSGREEDVFGENPSVLLISMGCGALGLNLTVASTVILMDPWWQSSAEAQAIDRTHRIGQTRDVKVFQIISDQTVEARVLEIQQTKEGLAETAFSGLRATGSNPDKREKLETSMKDLGRLFGMSEAQISHQIRSTGSSRS
ncbi:hypothetical protein CBS101457_003350 [Exobasidium rhododendri]|nr:hypothetical protein CBS101457_003350 [Exobasidium rhododendri]